MAKTLKMPKNLDTLQANNSEKDNDEISGELNENTLSSALRELAQRRPTECGDGQEVVQCKIMLSRGLINELHPVRQAQLQDVYPLLNKFIQIFQCRKKKEEEEGLRMSAL